MGLKQPEKNLCSNGNQVKIYKTTYRMGENCCKGYDGQGLHLLNVQTTEKLNSKREKAQVIKQGEDLQRHFSLEVSMALCTGTLQRPPNLAKAQGPTQGQDAGEEGHRL